MSISWGNWHVYHLSPHCVFVSILSRPPCLDLSALGKAYELSSTFKRTQEWRALIACPRVHFQQYNSKDGWLETLDSENEVTLLIRDALWFLSAFIIPVAQSPPQIYRSALSFVPFCRRKFLAPQGSQTRLPPVTVVPSQWLMITFVAECHKDIAWCIVLSLDEKAFLRPWSEQINCASAIMHTCDSETGHCRPISRNLNLSNWGD